jgi:hypothetical protein
MYKGTLEIDHFIFNQFRKIYPSLHTGTTPENISSIFKHGGFTNIHIETLHELCIASAEKMREDPKNVTLEPLTRIEDLKKKEEKHFYTL